MASELRKSGIDVIGGIPWGTHLCHFYETEDDFLDILIPYFKAGLENGEFCMWVVFHPLDKEKAIKALREAIPDTDRHLEANNIEILIPEEWYLDGDGRFDPQRVINGWREKLDQALRKGYAGMRVNGIESWLTKRDWKDFLEYEKELNDLVSDQKIIVLCTYPLVKSGAIEIFDIARTHQSVFAKRHGIWEIFESPELKQSKAEIKRLNESLERRVADRTKELIATNEELRREITRRKLVEIAEKESRQLYESLVESIDGIVCEMDGQTFQVTFVSKQAERILGYPEEQWLEEPDFWLNHLHPDDRDSALDAKTQAVAKLKGRELDYRMIAADGRVVWFRDILTVSLLRDDRVLLRGVKIDITERKQAEEESNQQREILEKIFDNIPVMIIFVDESGHYKLANRAWEETVGFSLEDARKENLDIGEYLHPDPKVRQERLDFTREATGEWKEFEVSIGGKQMVTSWTVVKLSDGTSIGIGQDVTEQKKAEQKNRRLLRDLSERVKELTALHRASDILQAEWTDIIPVISKLATLLPQAFQFPEAVGVRIRVGAAEATAEGFFETPFGLRAGFTTGDGQPGSIEVVYSEDIRRRAGNEGAFLAEEQTLINTAADMLRTAYDRHQAEAALRESEGRFRQLTENMREIFWLGAPDFSKTFYISPSYESVWGRTRDSMYKDPKSFLEAIHPQDRERAEWLITEMVRQETETEFRIVKTDGSIRWIRDRGFPIKDESGKVYYIGGIAEDITDRKRAEDALRQNNQELRALAARLQAVREDEAERISRELHDELGSVLTSLKWELEDIEKIFSKTRNETNFAALVEKKRELRGMIDSAINTVRKISSELRPKLLDDLGLIDALEWQAQQFEMRSGIVCEFVSEIENVDFSRERATAIFRIFQEALTNILRHAGAGKVNIRIRTANEKFILEVADNGRGISENQKFRSQSLGLLGMKERAHLLGGELEINGFEGTGTTIILEVPFDSQT